MKLAIDIDGVLAREDGTHDYRHKVPLEGMIELINKLAKNHDIILYTSRDIVDKSDTEWRLKKYGVKYNDIIFNKPKYDYILDDKALTLVNLQRLL